MWVAGVDGCKGGWIVVLVETTDSQPSRIELCKQFESILKLSPAVIVVDIPIGLLDKLQRGGRDCDRAARKLLGWPRRNSVFSPPVRTILDAKSYDEVRSQGMTKQAFGILHKIHEVDQLMTPAMQNIVHEGHPELAFLALAGTPMKFKKKRSLGRKERVQALSTIFPGISQEYSKALESFTCKQVSADDLLDAYSLAAVAYRIVEKKALSLPTTPQIDSKGLRMGIWY